MEFSSPENLQAFLARWLEEHGHDVYCHVPSPAGEEIDILTQDYAIDCSDILAHETLEKAAARLKGSQTHFPDQKLVVAGLTPKEQWDESYKLAETLKSDGIEVWFVDQMPPFVEYYRQLAKGRRGKAGSSLSEANPLTGCVISLGMAIILGLSFWLAYNILDRQQMRTATNTQEGRTWDQFHAAVEVWDLANAQTQLDELSLSRNRCVSRFADRFATTLEERGPEGFRDINPIKRALNQQDGCNLEIKEYEFSP